MFYVNKSQKLKKLYIKLIDKDLYCIYSLTHLDYKSKEDSIHSGMHNLSGVFIKEGDLTKFDDNEYFSFGVIFPNKNRTYYVENKDDYIEWFNNLRKVVGYCTITDTYEIKVNYAFFINI